MPEISRFFGIIITMYAEDHNPPHFHARHGDFRAVINIQTGDIIEGNMHKQSLRLPSRVEIHREELLANWEKGQGENPDFDRIEPLR